MDVSHDDWELEMKHILLVKHVLIAVLFGMISFELIKGWSQFPQCKTSEDVVKKSVSLVLGLVGDCFFSFHAAVIVFMVASIKRTSGEK